MEAAARGDASMERKHERHMPSRKAASSSALMLSGAQMFVGRQPHLKDIIENNHDTTESFELEELARSYENQTVTARQITSDVTQLVSATGVKTVTTLARNFVNQPHQLYVPMDSYGPSRQSAERDSLEVISN